MVLQQALSKCLLEWKQISQMDFALLTLSYQTIVSTSAKKYPSESILQNFQESDMLSQSDSDCTFYKVFDEDELSYILLVWSLRDEPAYIGELALCQVQSLLSAYAEKNDKNSFMQNLLLGKYSEIEAFNLARKLRIPQTAKRAIYLIETKKPQNAHALSTIRNIFSQRSNYITAMDDSRIIIIHELNHDENAESLEQQAFMLIDMLNTEAMISAWASYSNIADDLSDLENIYKEACTALEVGKIFYAESNVFGYNKLGIGRLIYQLPLNICEMFIDEIFEEECTPDTIDEESLITIRTFFENNLNLSETSRQLYIHRNTLVYRFEKLQKKYGLDVRTFEDALTFKIAMMVSDYIKYAKKK